MLPVRTLSTQLGIRPELFGWSRNVICVPHCHLLYNMSPRTFDRLRYCTNTGPISSNIFILDRFNYSKSSDDEHTQKFSTLQVFQSLLHLKNFFVEACKKNFNWFLYQKKINLLKINKQCIKRHHFTNFQKEGPAISLKKFLVAE